jgi:hypothetical protein
MSLPIERVADLCLADAFELGAPCRFHLWLCHPDCPLVPMVALLRAGVGHQQRTIDADGVHRADTISSPSLMATHAGDQTEGGLMIAVPIWRGCERRRERGLRGQLMELLRNNSPVGCGGHRVSRLCGRVHQIAEHHHYCSHN